MAEVGIDISKHSPLSIEKYLNDDFYLVATVCDNARDSCPTFTGNCEHIIHHGFQDPADAEGSDKKIMETYRQVRDEIKVWMEKVTSKYIP